MSLTLRRIALGALLATLPSASAFGQGVDRSEDFFRLFLGDLKAEAQEARASGRKGLLVMYHFDACPYCARMRREVLSRPEVQKAFQLDFITIALDTRGSQPITDFDGQVMPENDYARLAGVIRTPSFDFFDTSGRHVYRHAGGIFDPREFMRLGQFIADGAYRTQSFSDFLKTQKKGR